MRSEWGDREVQSRGVADVSAEDGVTRGRHSVERKGSLRSGKRRRRWKFKIQRATIVMLAITFSLGGLYGLDFYHRQETCPANTAQPESDDSPQAEVDDNSIVDLVPCTRYDLDYVLLKLIPMPVICFLAASLTLLGKDYLRYKKKRKRRERRRAARLMSEARVSGGSAAPEFGRTDARHGSRAERGRIR